jgi:hypothetical protein
MFMPVSLARTVPDAAIKRCYPARSLVPRTLEFPLLQAVKILTSGGIGGAANSSSSG